jgi:hypothetical protein
LKFLGVVRGELCGGGGVDLGGLPWLLVQAGRERAAMGQDARCTHNRLTNPVFPGHRALAFLLVRNSHDERARTVAGCSPELPAHAVRNRQEREPSRFGPGALTGMLADVGVSAPVPVMVSVGFSVRCDSVQF